MKSVLISIQPKWCKLIASGEKTIEVRKTRPKLETPFKCYIYCTKGMLLYENFPNGTESREINLAQYDYAGQSHALNGKVIGEFVCDRIDSYIKKEGNRYWWTFCSPEEIEEIKGKTCLTLKEIVDYAGNSKHLYGWHISDLKIYDKPKELSGVRVGKVALPCGYGNYNIYDKVLTRPPQSWCYVES